jgi:hypothetical protein
VYDGEIVCHSESPVPKKQALRLNNGHWHHVVFVVDAQHADGDVLTVYIDGFSFPLHCAEGAAKDFMFQKAPSVDLSSIYLGAAVVSGDRTLKVTRQMQGEMDSVAFFSRALTKSEVSFLAADMPCSSTSTGGSGYAFFAGEHDDSLGNEWLELDIAACLAETPSKTVTVAFHYLQSSAPQTEFSLVVGGSHAQAVGFHGEGTAANDLQTWVDTAPVVLRADSVSRA